MSTLSLSALTFAQQALAAGVRGGQPARFQGPEVTAYLTDVGIAYPAAWCAAFVYWCFEQAVAAGVVIAIGHTAATAQQMIAERMARAYHAASSTDGRAP